MKSVAIIGAGISGLVLARRLAAHARVTVFEKARGAGGRLSTRRVAPFAFDHGAQFFTAKTDRFKSFLQPLIGAGVLTRWDADFAELDHGQLISQRRWDTDCPHYVAMPGMSALGRYLGGGLDLRLKTRVTGIAAVDGGWRLRTDPDCSPGVYDWVVCAAPAAQSARLMPPAFGHIDALRDTVMRGCFALLLGLRCPPELAWQAARVRNATVSWISVNSSKPGRHGGSSIVVHATNAWSDAHLDDDTGAVQRHLVREASKVTGLDLSSAAYCAVHRWRYANAGRQSGTGIYLDEDNALAACGDWCVQGCVEAAFISGSRIADRLVAIL